MALIASFVAIALLSQTAGDQQNQNESCLCSFRQLKRNCTSTAISGGGRMFYKIFHLGLISDEGIMKCWSNLDLRVTRVNLIAHKNVEDNCTEATNRTLTKLFSGLFIILCNDKLSNSSNTDWPKPNWSQNVSALFDSLNTFKLRSLKIDGFNIDYKNDLFNNFPNLEILEMIDANLSSLPPFLLKNLIRLKKFDSSENKLRQIPDGFFENQKELEELFLNFNQFKQLVGKESNFLSPLKRLEKLDLSYNQISKIDPSFFNSAVNMKELHLQQNRLTFLTNIFASFDNSLTFLNLSYNKLHVLSNTDFWCLTRLKFLDLSGNRLTNIQQFALENLKSLRYLHLDRNFLTFDFLSVAPNFPNDLYVLDLSRNRLNQIPAESIQPLKSLWRLDLSGNNITYVKVIDFSLTERKYWSTRIDLRNNNIFELYLRGFYREGSISSARNWNIDWILDLNDNPINCDCNLKPIKSFEYILGFQHQNVRFLIDRLKCDRPKPLENYLLTEVAEKLSVCELLQPPARCSINCNCFELRNGSFFVDCENAKLKRFPRIVPSDSEIKIVNLDFNQIIGWKPLVSDEQLTGTSLRRSLEKLSLRNNNLMEISVNFFWGLNDITRLDLSYNRLTTLPIGIFGPLLKLTSLNVGNNALVDFPSDLLKTNLLLNFFNLSVNNLINLKLDFSRFINLSTIDFSNNRIGDLSEIIWPANLRIISLAGNSISYLGPIKSLPANLTFLDLSFNSITNVHVNEFVKFNSIVINLKSNGIKYVYFNNDENSFKSVILQLDYNPLTCDEENLNFLKRLQNDTVEKLDYSTVFKFEVENLYCFEPISKKGKLFSTMKISHLPTKETDFITTDFCRSYFLPNLNYRSLECIGIPSQFTLTQTERNRNIQQLYARDGFLSSLINLKRQEWGVHLEVVVLKNFNPNEKHVLRAVFDEMSRLKFLTITECQIKVIEENAFDKLTQLVELDLSLNQILKIPNLSNNIELKKLNLSENALKEIGIFSFKNCCKIQVLDLSYNKLDRLSYYEFENLEFLSILRIRGNRLTSLHERFIVNCDNLQILDLSHNFLPNHQLSNLIIPSNIQNLNASHNLIEDLNHKWINNLNNSLLRSADFSFNGINKIFLRQILSLPRPLKLFLNNNNISQFEWQNFTYSAQAHRSIENKIDLVIGQNPFNCDCNLKGFLQFVGSKQTIDPIAYLFRRQTITDKLNADFPLEIQNIDIDSLQCSSPKILKGKFLKNLKIDQLFCDLENCGMVCSNYIRGSDDKNVVECENVVLSSFPIPCSSRTTATATAVLIFDSSVLPTLVELQRTEWMNLTILVINKCKINDELKSDSLNNQMKLKELRLTRNGLKMIPTNLLRKTNELEILDLNGNKLESFSSEIINFLFNLRILDLSDNRMKSISHLVFTKGIEMLNISSNFIQFLRVSTQTPGLSISNMKYLNVSRNRLRNFENDSNVFYKLSNLQFLDVSFNNLTFDCNSTERCKKFLPSSLQELRVTQNGIRCFEFCNWRLFPFLKLIDFSHNPINSIKLQHLVFANNSGSLIRCRNCHIKRYSLDLTETLPIKNSLTLDIAGNEIECLCNITRLHSRRELKKQNFSCKLNVINNFSCLNSGGNLSNNLDKLSNVTAQTPSCKVIFQCPNECECLKADLEIDNRIAMFCKNKTLTDIPKSCPKNTQYLNLDDNYITDLIGLDEIRWEKLIDVSLRNNKIFSISDTNWPGGLRAFYLDGNKLARPSGWLRKLIDQSPSFRLTLSNNPWICDCDNENFHKWVMLSQSVEDVWNMSCSDGKSFVESNFCKIEKSNNEILIYISVPFLVVIVGLIVSVSYFKNKKRMLMWIYSNNICLLNCIGIGESVDDIDKQYDAFVSYANEDAEFVEETLLSTLENEEFKYKLCIHERDWILGEQIVDQIATSIEKSRRVIVILSDNFVESRWAPMEFQMAILKSMEDRVNRIVMIVLDDNFSADGLDRQLRTYVSLNTYLKRSDPRFWDKLLYAMSRPRARITKKKRKNKRSTAEQEFPSLIPLEPLAGIV